MTPSASSPRLFLKWLFELLAREGPANSYEVSATYPSTRGDFTGQKCRVVLGNPASSQIGDTGALDRYDFRISVFALDDNDSAYLAEQILGGLQWLDLNQHHSRLARCQSLFNFSLTGPTLGQNQLWVTTISYSAWLGKG